MNKTFIWWKFLSLVAVFNILLWMTAIWMRTDLQAFSIYQPVLSGIYVLVCAFRSFYPRVDLERYCLIDSPLSSVVLGRSFATVAELSFSIQCALLIYDLGLALDSALITSTAFAIVPIIVMAQICCWTAVLTLNHFWHAMEELAWVVMIALAAVCFVYGMIQLQGFYQLMMAIGLLSCVGSAYVMLFKDIPMYLMRAREGEKAGIRYLSLQQGVNDALERRIATSDWKIWKQEAAWITPYFTFGVWLSIGMVMINFNL